MVLLYQAEYREFESLLRVFDAISISLLREVNVLEDA